MTDNDAGPGAPQDDQQDGTNILNDETPDDAPGAQSDGNGDNRENGDTFPRSYVEELRAEAADHRTKAKAADDRADAFAKRLHTALVEASNRLENPSDLPFDADHLEDADKLSAALDALLADRPYFAKRVVKGDAGQGARGGPVEPPFSLLSRLKGGT